MCQGSGPGPDYSSCLCKIFPHPLARYQGGAISQASNKEPLQLFAWGPSLLKTQDIKPATHLYPSSPQLTGKVVSITLGEITLKCLLFLGPKSSLVGSVPSVLICWIRKPCFPRLVSFPCSPGVSRDHGLSMTFLPESVPVSDFLVSSKSSFHSLRYSGQKAWTHHPWLSFLSSPPSNPSVYSVGLYILWGLLIYDVSRLRPFF